MKGGRQSETSPKFDQAIAFALRGWVWKETGYDLVLVPDEAKSQLSFLSPWFADLAEEQKDSHMTDGEKETRQ